MDTKNLTFNEQGLMPVIVQSEETGEVLMLAYMNEEAIQKTVTEKIAHYYSRSRKSLWKKGETSGNIQKVKSFYYDCDADALLLKVEQTGVACHTGKMSCFFNPIIEAVNTSSNRFLLTSLYATIEERKQHPGEGSYTNYLFDKGLDKILKKVGEETAEVIIASKNNDAKETIYEISDLVYHTLVLMVNQGIQISDISQELTRRNQKK